jgi:hypothetical protein
MSILWPLGLFGVAAVGGLVMAVRVLVGKAPPWLLSLLHALLGATGLACLFIVLSGAESLPFAPLVTALGLLIAAALGGLFLASFHLRRKSHPKLGLVVHALAAVSGFSVLAAVAFGAL